MPDAFDLGRRESGNKIVGDHGIAFGMSLSLGLSVAFSLFAATGPAGMLEAPDGSDFKIDLAVDGASTCVVWPQRLHDAAACAGVDTAALAKAAAAQPPTGGRVAVIHFADWSLIAVVAIQPSSLGSISEEDLDEYMAGVGRALHDQGAGTLRRNGAGKEWEPFAAAGTNGVRYSAVVDPQNRILGWALFGGKSDCALNLFVDTAREEPARTIGEKLLARVSMSPLSPTQKRTFGKTRAFQAGYHAGRTLLFLGVLAGLVWLVVRAFRAKQR